MKKAELVEAILEDMYKYNSKIVVDNEWKAYLNRQKKRALEMILDERMTWGAKNERTDDRLPAADG